MFDKAASQDICSGCSFFMNTLFVCRIFPSDKNITRKNRIFVFMNTPVFVCPVRSYKK